VRTSDVKLGVVVDGGLACQLAQALGGPVIHHQAQRTVVNQKLHRVEEPVIHRLNAVTHTHTHTHTRTQTQGEKGRRDFQYAFYYDELLLNSIPDQRVRDEKKKHHREN